MVENGNGMSYRKLFWGFIFLFDFRIGGFDILPDFIGFIFIYIGLKALAGKDAEFKRAGSLALPLIFMSVLDVYQAPSTQASLLGIIFGLALTLLIILMVRGICMGIRNEAAKAGNDGLASKATNRWGLFLAVNILLILFTVVPVLAAVLFIPFFILSIISYVLMVSLMKSAEYSLLDGPPEV
ncbi:MAG: hypothetical protein JXB33_06455 [Clostridia bacterium]|nr:hypothetical protein [Clostridia bacterium]